MNNLIMRDELYVEGLDRFCRNWLRPDYVAAEIGVFAGEGSAILSKHVTRLVCIDSWSKSYNSEILVGCENAQLIQDIRSVTVDIEQAEREFDELAAKLENIIKIKAPDNVIVGLIADSSLDAIYVDAAHTYEAVLPQLIAWRPKVRPGGVIAGHDYSSDWPGVVAAVEEVFGRPQEIFSDTSWAVRQSA
tara:strand:- start:2751 stop:3320 length:570 start_codon:yes stop_codon:yes gene_type:complete